VPVHAWPASPRLTHWLGVAACVQVGKALDVNGLQHVSLLSRSREEARKAITAFERDDGARVFLLALRSGGLQLLLPRLLARLGVGRHSTWAACSGRRCCGADADPRQPRVPAGAGHRPRHRAAGGRASAPHRPGGWAGPTTGGHPLQLCSLLPALSRLPRLCQAGVSALRSHPGPAVLPCRRAR
jgi:hypothetical protein